MVVEPLPALRSISVEGFKSINEELTIDLGKLTVLAGVNSSGKSSIIQPLLLLKQTLEAPFDPGPLRLNGPNVKFTKVEQLLCANRRKEELGRFAFGMTLDDKRSCKFYFRHGTTNPIELDHIVSSDGERTIDLREGNNSKVDKNYLDLFIGHHLQPFGNVPVYSIETIRSRCFLDQIVSLGSHERLQGTTRISMSAGPYDVMLRHIIHVPGLRGNPERAYSWNAVSSQFPGTFENYTASVLAVEKSNATDFLDRLSHSLRYLQLAWKVDAKTINDTQVELRVGILTYSNERDMVNIADVGFGVSQTLPVVVALLTAKPNQIVYIEQPEIHLHPRAQHAMAKLLVDAANRGVQVIIETHSSILLLGIQSLIAENAIDPEIVKLHWFRRDKTGDTQIASAELDVAGRFGDWPEDFDDVSLEAQRRYLDAAEKQLQNER